MVKATRQTFNEFLENIVEEEFKVIGEKFDAFAKSELYQPTMSAYKEYITSDFSVNNYLEQYKQDEEDRREPLHEEQLDKYDMPIFEQVELEHLKETVRDYDTQDLRNYLEQVKRLAKTYDKTAFKQLLEREIETYVSRNIKFERSELIKNAFKGLFVEDCLIESIPFIRDIREYMEE